MFIIRAILIGVVVYLITSIFSLVITVIVAGFKQAMKFIWSGMKFAFRKQTKELGDV